MDFFQTVTAMLVYRPGSLSALLFVFSAVLLLLGVAIQTRASAFQLRFLDDKRLNWIEKTHPHIPSIRVVLTIALCSVTLLVAGLQTIQGVPPFNDPWQGLNLASLFLLAGSLGILGELQWKGAGQYACAILTGTALAFLFLILLSGSASGALSITFALAALLIASMFLSGRTLRRQRGTILALMLSTSFWLFIFFLFR